MRIAKLIAPLTLTLRLTLSLTVGFTPIVVKADTTAEIEAATQQWISAFNHKDAKGIVALYANDAVFFGTSSPLLRDKPELVADYFKALPTLGDAVVTLGEHRIQVFGDVAINTGYYTRSFVQEGKTIANPARFTFVYAKRAGKWVIVNHHSSALPTP